MNYLKKIRTDLAKSINQILQKNLIFDSDFVYPPDAKMGNISLPCFGLAKSLKKNPIEIAKDLAQKLPANKNIAQIQSTGAYLNFVFNKEELAENIITQITKEEDKYGKTNIGKKQKIMVEFAHPNTHKVFHIGHLRNAITGESIARILEALGYKIIRANYQGDVGPHVAKCVWGVQQLEKEYDKINNQKTSLDKKVEFLGKAYVLGSNAYEEDEKAKQEITDLNKKIYEQDKKIIKIYQTTRAWSLEYFNKIYKLLDTKFDRFYFESEVFEEGKQIALDSLQKNILTKSNGAIIFEGSKHGLHDRVFINSQGFPTYEAKELGLAKLQLSEYNPQKIIHVVANEQAEYFKVVLCALAKIFPETKQIEEHLSYAMVDLKNGKMSSRKGNVLAGEWLINLVKTRINDIAEENKISKNKENILQKISLAAVKYFILKNGITTKILFDVNASVSLTGNSGPYLQYTYVRIYSIIKNEELQGELRSKRESHGGRMKNLKQVEKGKVNLSKLEDPKEHELILKLAKYPETVLKAGQIYDPSEIAKYLFELCKLFNDYYHAIQILKAEKEIMQARLALVKAASQVIKNGLNLLGIDVVDKM